MASSLSRKPRLWTQEQVQFVLDQILTGKSHKEIAALCNVEFKDVGKSIMESDHVKYIKAQYKRQLSGDRSRNEGSITLDTIQVQSYFTCSDSQASNSSASQTSDSTMATSSQKITSTYAASNQGAEVVPSIRIPDVRNPVATEVEQVVLAIPQDSQRSDPKINRTNFGQPGPAVVSPLTHRTTQSAIDAHRRFVPHNENPWHRGPHPGCDIEGRHCHNDDGSIDFPSVEEFMATVLRVKGPSVRLSDLADAMDRIQAEENVR